MAPEPPPNNYEAEAHDIYLGKNRRLADPVFFPASKRSNHEMRIIEENIVREMELEPDGPREFTKDVMVLWGWGICTRWPPGGPVPRLEDYERSMDAMTADIHNHWKEIQSLVRNHEDAIRDWILRVSPGIEKQESRDKSTLYAGIQQSWERTVKTFNDCADDIKMFMKSDSIESDFEIDVPNYPEYEKTRRLPFSFMCENFLMGYTHTPPEGRDHYVAFYSHPYNFFNDQPDEEEPDLCECEILGCQFNDKESREFYKGQRILFLAPHIASCDLQDPNCLLSFIHYRGRQHPSVFAKMDNDMTFIGRRTYHLTGPLIPNRMVSFDVSKGYRPKLWKGWASRPNPGISGESKEEYDHLWHQGQLFGASEAWIMLQSQRATYHYLRHLLGFICREAKLQGFPKANPKPPGELERIFRSSRTSVEVINQRALANWFAFTKQQAFLPPPIQISPRYLKDLQFKIEVAEKHIQELFSDPGYFFDCINTLKGHHWANIEMQKDETTINDRGLASIYVEKYVEEDYRHILYFDLIRGVLRRSIFEFYMWHAVYTRLQEFQTTVRQTFKDYGKEEESDTDGIKMLQQPPMFLSDKTKRDHAALAEKYLSLVVLLRYDAVFFINEFRKKGIHAGDHTVFEVAYSVDPPQGEETQSRQTSIQKKHYGAPDLKCRPKFRNQWLRVDEHSADEILRMFFFNSMENFISNALNCTNCGITEAAGYLQAMSRAHDPDSTKLIFTDLMDDTIDNLNLLSSLADHLECLWPAMDKVGGAAVDETVRRRYFDLGSKDISINFLDFDDFDFEKKIPTKRLKRLFLFFDELQGFKDESISMGHARGDLKRFGASLLCKFICPLNSEGRGSKANQEAISRLEKAMGVSGTDYVFNVKETPFNLDEIKAGKGAKVHVVSQPSSYRNIAARERDKARERQQEREAFHDAVWVERDSTAEMYKYNPRWMQTLHSTLEQLQLPPVPGLVEPLVDALSRISIQSAPKAPDGQPKGIIKKRDWATLEAVYNIHGSANAAVSYAQLKLAMGAMGYKEDPSGGSHMRFVRQDGRWPHDVLPKGENVIVARTHGGERAAAAKGKAMDWGKRFVERGLTFDFIQQWYVKG